MKPLAAILAQPSGVVVLFPVRLDEAVFVTKEAWALKLRDNRHIGDLRTCLKTDPHLP